MPPRSQPPAPFERRAATVPQVTYHGGPVLHSSGVFAIFWVPPGYALPNGYAQTVTQYFTDVAHDSFLPSNVFGADTQYYDVTKGVKKFASYSVVFHGSNVDTRAFPKSGCPNYVLDTKAGSKSKVCLTDAQVQAEVKSVITSHSLPTGIGNQYFLFTPPGVANCKAAKPAHTRGCFDPIQQDGYCAYHSHVTVSGHAVLYAMLPYEASTGVCWSGQSPNGNDGDSVVNTASHEQNESITDPLGTGWYDSAGNEIGDKCHLVFGGAVGSTSTGRMYNEVINGHGYWLQEVWSNRATRVRAAQHVPPAQRLVRVLAEGARARQEGHVRRRACRKRARRASPIAGRSPTAAVASATNPTHKFAKPVFVGIVTLIVTDVHGDQTRVTKAITVTVTASKGRERSPWCSVRGPEPLRSLS